MAKTRLSDATFDLNLAPILDIIVSIVPLLLLSIAFVQVKMIDSSVPQVVAEAAQRANEKSPPTVTLKVSKTKGFVFEVAKDGNAPTSPVLVPNKNNTWDLEGLHAAAFTLKEKNAEVFRVDLAPEADVNLNDLVVVMDKLRRTPESKKVAFVDPASGQKVETELMFPNVLFANVLGN
jgi:biopolymer transport protein ExbD